MPALKKLVKPPRSKSAKSHSRPFPIVAIGASAGGLEAVTSLLTHLPSNTGMAYVYIQHLDPTHQSMLTLLLQKATKMKVMEAKNHMPIRRNHLFVIPPGQDMSIIDGVLRLQPRKPKPAIHLPINEFFLSLAEKQRDGAIGIVLSGNASDGALGLKAIKGAGGLTFAQDESAKFQSMPKSAIAEGVVDSVLSPEGIANELARLSNHTSVMQRTMKDGEEEVPDEEELVSILHLLRKSIGVDFLHYKKSTISRRMIRRMLLHKFENLKDYAQYLRQHTAEINLLYQDLLINVTSFFRDENAMEFLKKTLLPKILKHKSAQDPIRIWVPGCSSGEEAYSIAILLIEVLKEKAADTPVQIFATDLSEVAIMKARSGIYSKAEIAKVPPKRLQNFFTRVDGSYRIIKSIRELCVFATHNILKDPPFSRLDFISCCNMLIYLDASLQKKLMSTFHYALNSGGYLMLAKSETIGAAGGLFGQLDKKYKIYCKKSDAAARVVYESTERLREGERANEPGVRRKPEVPESAPLHDLEKTVDSILLTHYTPASVVTNNDLDILQFRGSTGLYLEPAPGKASLNLLKMARTGLPFELRSAVLKARRSGKLVRKSGIEIRHKGSTHKVGFEVHPFKADADELLYLITFEEALIPIAKEEKPSSKKDVRAKQLQQELREAKETMRSYMEEHEVVNEELQSANEEIVSSNEELQSINEELETSKEEIEASNEELQTINGELQMRNEQLAEADEYTRNMIDTVREAMIVLSHDLRVKSCNKSFCRLFKVREEDMQDRLIYELGNHQWDIPALRELLEDIIPHNTFFDNFKVEHHFEGIGDKVIILNARKMIQKTRGEKLILLAMEDVTEYVIAQKIIAEREKWFRDIADSAPVMMWFADTTKARTFFNKTWLDYTGKKMEEETGSGWLAEIHPEDKEQFLKIYNKAYAEQKAYTAEYRLHRHDGVYRWKLSLATPSYDNSGKFSGFVGSVTDIHDKKLAEEILKESEKRIRNVLESLPQIAFTMLPEGTVHYSNYAWYRFTGDDPNHPWQGDERRKLDHPEDIPVLKNWLSKLEQGVPFEGEARIKGKDGEYRWFLTRIVPVKNADANIVQWIGTSTDVHNQKLLHEKIEYLLEREKFARLEIEANENKVRSILEAIPHMAWMADANGNLNFVNKGHLDYTGLTLQEALSGNRQSTIHPEDIEEAYSLRNEHFKSGLPYFVKVRYKRASDGMYRWHLVRAVPLKDDAGKITAWVGTNTDIHEQETFNELLLESAAKVRAVLEGLPQMAWMTDAEGKINFVNRGYTAYTGQSLESAMHGGIEEIIHPKDYEDTLPVWNKNLKSGEPVEINARYKRAADGEYRWHLVRATAIRDATGSITSWVGINTDVHDQKMFSEELERAVKMRTAELKTANFNLSRSNKELQQFAFAASHDLQEPLRKIQTFIDRINNPDSEKLTEQTRDYFSRITNAATRMRQLIEDMLNLSRAGVDGKPFHETDLNTLMKEAITNYDLNINQKNAYVDLEPLPTIECIPSQMQQLFENLLNNALKFTESPAPKITVKSRELSHDEIKPHLKFNDETAWYEITFTDNGIGFEQKFADQIFVTFQRLHDARKYPGTGIGLALCKKIVLNHGGEIYAESKEGNGTTFHILLPGKQQEKEEG